MALHHNELQDRKTREEYFALLERDPAHRYEYLNGHVYMMTGGRPDHSLISNNIGRVLGNLLQGRCCIVYNSDLYVELSENYRVCPDVTVSGDPRDRGAKDAVRYPPLVVEVLSPATEARDRGQKSLQYRSCPSIQAYLLISTEAPIIEVFRREKHGFWSLYTLGLNGSVDVPHLNIRRCIPECLHYHRRTMTHRIAQYPYNTIADIPAGCTMHTWYGSDLPSPPSDLPQGRHRPIVGNLVDSPNLP